MREELFIWRYNKYLGWICRPLDYEDFISRLDINKNGWPFKIDELDKYFNEAKKFWNQKLILTINLILLKKP